MPVRPKVVTRRAIGSAERTIERPDAAGAPLSARKTPLSARLASAGRKAFARYLDQLESIVKQGRGKPGA